MSREPRVVIIGAGMAGITALHVFTRRGFAAVTVLEKASDVGGVWHWNRYPGLTCDVPSQLYQFGFAPKPDWSHLFADGPDIQRYHREVVESLGLAEHIQLNTEVVAAQWDDDAANWTLTTASGDRIGADVVVCATGVLHHPAVPELPGLDEFAGATVHTARWDDSVATDHKHIAVIGTGSTGVQIVSALQPAAASITHYVRSPQWILWAPMSLRQSELVSTALRRFPAAHDRLYRTLLWASGILADVTTRPSWRRRAVQGYARLCLRLQVRDPVLRSKLTPDYQPLCKRQVVSETYYRAIQSANAELVTERIDEVTPHGIRTADGRHRPADVIVLATGFAPHNYMRPMQVTGRDGLTIEKAWANGPRAYRMTAIPGFPNLFTMLGPNSPTGSISLQYSAERTAEYIARFLAMLRDGIATSIEVTEEATDEFNDAVAAAMPPTVWNTGCNSWYLTDNKTIDLWPYNRATLTSMLAVPEPAHFDIR
ncbi:flavin-containing monooxygenase [Mycobacterium asiaticum]|uniref:Monooxygenase n=1 Tax=Mycobacterium asiaticum TaxID=1790 RepID=A0A1A3BN86_MYCAS|nr:NAD(P)/FAD-dependent oxidoreductase [Mycobacterium asiaticum]OBI76430.1 monooxygenase [Mycobacterium asiaticum]